MTSIDMNYSIDTEASKFDGISKENGKKREYKRTAHQYSHGTFFV